MKGMEKNKAGTETPQYWMSDCLNFGEQLLDDFLLPLSFCH